MEHGAGEAGPAGGKREEPVAEQGTWVLRNERLYLVTGQNGQQEPRLELPYIAVGTARLPAASSEEQTRILTIELTVSLPDGRIVDVASTIPLPGYIALLQRLLNGLQLSEVEEATQQLGGHLGGPLLRPTIAALQKAAAVQEAAPRPNSRVPAS